MFLNKQHIQTLSSVSIYLGLHQGENFRNKIKNKNYVVHMQPFPRRNGGI